MNALRPYAVHVDLVLTAPGSVMTYWIPGDARPIGLMRLDDGRVRLVCETRGADAVRVEVFFVATNDVNDAALSTDALVPVAGAPLQTVALGVVGHPTQGARAVYWRRSLHVAVPSG